MRHESSFYEFMLEKNSRKIVMIRHDVYWFVAKYKKHLGGSEAKVRLRSHSLGSTQRHRMNDIYGCNLTCEYISYKL